MSADHARLGLHQQVVGFLIAIGAVGAVAGDAAPDEARMARGELVVAEAEAFDRAGREVVHEDVGARDESRAHVAVALASSDRARCCACRG